MLILENFVVASSLTALLTTIATISSDYH